jgi:hypothetical protein
MIIIDVKQNLEQVIVSCAEFFYYMNKAIHEPVFKKCFVFEMK